MSEEIIIDGVNVGECSYYNKENKPYCCEIWDNECEAQNCYYKQYLCLKQELQKYKDMEAKGLEEFKDVGGCWGCGLKLQLNRDIEDIKQLKQENEKLKERNKKLELAHKYTCSEKLYKHALEEIREITKELKQTKIPFCEIEEKIQNIINEVLND